MNGPRELIAALLQLTLELRQQLGNLYLSVDRQLLAVQQQVLDTLEAVAAESLVILDQAMQHVFQLLLPAVNDMAIVTISTMDALTVVTVYSVYVWTDLAIQSVQAVMQVPSVEMPIEGDVPGGIAVWLLAVFAIATYTAVYYEYSAHEDLVGTVLQLMLPVLYMALWKSDRTWAEGVAALPISSVRTGQVTGRGICGRTLYRSVRGCGCREF